MGLTRTHALLSFTIVLAAFACDVDTVPDGLRRTPQGPGARVVYDPPRRPLPEVPLPSDLATFPDPTSRTGIRVNISLDAPTRMERAARSGLNELEGWGTYAPITAAFSKSEEAAPGSPALDLDEIRRRMPKGDFDFADDPVYVVNLRTGVPVVLDMGSGSLPVVMRDPHLYWANDPAAQESNLFFETREEGAGLMEYRPELDTDFDGVLDHPNTHGPFSIHGYDDLLTWYERETDTLILRPLVPLDEKTEYAVVFTDRLLGSDGRPILSPFEFVHHMRQRDGAARVRDVLNDPSRAPYFGDLAGTGLDHVAFMWTFTTQPVHEDLRLLRDGLEGRGPFARLAAEFPPEARMIRAAGDTSLSEDTSDAWRSNPSCSAASARPNVFDLGQSSTLDAFTQLISLVTNQGDRETASIAESLSNIAHVAIGEIDVPYLIGDPEEEHVEDRFHLNFVTGEGDVRRAKVKFVAVVPKETATRKQPFPAAIVGHGYGSSSVDAIVQGGELARRGIATVAIDMPHHGLALTPAQEGLLRAAFLGFCYVPFAETLIGGRAHDINRDGVKDSGWWWFTSHLFHVRDNMRQAIVEYMQLARIVSTFDGRRADGGGIAGDFDGNGVPDVGGPLTSIGGSLGGMMTQILGAVDPRITASVAVVGGGGLTDIGIRSYGVANSVIEQTVTPLVVAVPGSDFDPNAPTRQTNCGGADRSVRFVVNDGRDSVDVEIACLRPDELSEGMTVLVTNVTTGEVRCAGTWGDGRFRVSLPASTYDRVDIQIYAQPHAVRSYGTCELVPDARIGRRVNTFEQPAPSVRAVAGEAHCDGEQGCAQFLDRFFPVGSDLVAPQEGLGIPRQTPLFRRLFGLGQVVLDTADPINFAAYYARKPLLDPDGVPVPPRGIFNIPSVGDNYVATHAGIAFARAAGMVPFLPPSFAARYPEYAEFATPAALYDELGGKTPNQVLVDTFTTEGLGRLERTPAGPSCRANRLDIPECELPLPPGACRRALFDVDWISEGRLPFDQQHLARPLRLTRRADVAVTGPSLLDAAWEPRIVGAPFAERGFAPGPPLLANLLLYSDPEGTHAPLGGACSVWDPQRYVLGVAAHYLATRGTDVLYVSRPRDHQCLAETSCDFLR